MKNFYRRFAIILCVALFCMGLIVIPAKKAISPAPIDEVSGTRQSPTSIEQNFELKNIIAPVIETSSVQTNTVIREKVQGGSIVLRGKYYPLRTYKELSTPSDPRAQQTWTTQANVESSWEVGSGSQETTLAIIDTGFAMNHEEFVGRWHQNNEELGNTDSQNPSKLNCQDQGLALNESCNLIDDDFDGNIDNESGPAFYQNPSRLNCSDQARALDRSCNLVDDDNNGLVDDVRGWDFINHDNSVMAGELNPTGDSTKHGSYVTGVAAATGNNGKGLAGVDWHTKILPIQALDDDGYGNSVSVARAIRYATEQGADVINISLGSDLEDEVVRDAALEAIAAGSIVVAASGNDGCNCISYPANYPEIVAVGALGDDGNPADFSSYGTNLDILAPGEGLYTTNWRSTNGTSSYATVSGTSLATPLVSATLSRLKSQIPSANAQQLVAILTESVSRTGFPTSLPHSTSYGFGKLNTLNALNRSTTPYTPIQLYGLSPISGGNTLTPNSPAEASSQISLYDCIAPRVPTTPVYELSKSGRRFYSASRAEISQALNLGYSANFFAYACMQQPHDSPQVKRNINMLQEFKNLNTKPL